MPAFEFLVEHREAGNEVLLKDIEGVNSKGFLKNGNRSSIKVQMPNWSINLSGLDDHLGSGFNRERGEIQRPARTQRSDARHLVPNQVRCLTPQRLGYSNPSNSDLYMTCSHYQGVCQDWLRIGTEQPDVCLHHR